MRTILGLLVALMVVGCGRVESRLSPTGPDNPVSPVYAAPAGKVFIEAKAACLEYFGEIDEANEQSRSIVNDDFAFWVGGRTVTVLRVEEINAEQSAVHFMSEGAFPAGFLALGGRQRYIIRWLIDRLDRNLPRSSAP